MVWSNNKKTSHLSIHLSVYAISISTEKTQIDRTERICYRIISGFWYRLSWKSCDESTQSSHTISMQSINGLNCVFWYWCDIDDWSVAKVELSRIQHLHSHSQVHSTKFTSLIDFGSYFIILCVDIVRNWLEYDDLWDIEVISNIYTDFRTKSFIILTTVVLELSVNWFVYGCRKL